MPTLDFSADRPIRFREADLLNRTAFAEQIAKALRGWTGRDSLVLALYGPWGSGKSSLKYMVLESLQSDQATSPYVVEFNPWQWAGQDQLAQAFFTEIGKRLGKEDKSKQAKTSAKRLQKYAALLGIGEALSVGIRKLALSALLIIASLGIIGGLFVSIATRAALGTVGLLSLFLYILLNSSRLFTNALAKYFSSIAAVETRTLDEVKDDLANLLRTLSRPVLVVIDDVDRLTGPELMLLFQLIKANADFPNVVYVVLFQREVVERNLTNELSSDGREYLKKIVQVGFDVPSVERSRLEAILFSKLNPLLQAKSVQSLWQQERWADVYIPGVGPYFATLRDVYRFISVLSLQVSVFSRDDAFEVNPIDLIALEVLRVFEPEVYRALPALKTTLTHTNSFGSARAQAQTTQKTEIQTLVQKAPEAHRKRVEEILAQVFPPIAWAFNGSVYGSGHSDQWYREHRACHPDVFDKYFQLTIPQGDLSHGELENLVSFSGDRQAFVKEFQAIGKRGLTEIAVDRLEAYKETISLDHAVPFLTAMFDIGDELPPGSMGLSEIAPAMHAARIVYWYLKREPDIQKRESILSECITQTTGTYLPSFVVALEGDRAKENREEGSRLADDAGVKRLQEQCVSKIRQAAADSSLSKHARMGELLSLWRAWSSAEEVQRWVSKLVESPESLLSFLRTCLRKTMSYGFSRYMGRASWSVDLESLQAFADPEMIEARLATINTDKLEGQDRKAVEEFRKALQRKREGKPRRSILDVE